MPRPVHRKSTAGLFVSAAASSATLAVTAGSDAAVFTAVFTTAGVLARTEGHDTLAGAAIGNYVAINPYIDPRAMTYATLPIDPREMGYAAFPIDPREMTLIH